MSEHQESGIVNVIQPNQHPNLFFNQEEIDALRQSIVENREPEMAAEAYFNHVQGTQPAGKPDGMDDLSWDENYYTAIPIARQNMKACFSYMLEPTEQKAERLRDALLSWTSTQDDSAAWMRDVQNSGWIQFPMAFMYDLIYTSDVVDHEHVQQFDSWFQYSADRLIRDPSWWNEPRSSFVSEEGETRYRYPNWHTIREGAGQLCALVSHDQSLVDKGFNSDVPPDYYDMDLSDYEGTRDLQNLISGLVFPSGYNWDGYSRYYGFDAPDESFTEAGEPERGNGQHYHFYAALPLVMAAEGATHNGANAFEYGNNALLRTFRQASDWAHRAWRGTADHIESEDWTQSYWMIYRRHPDDETIREVAERASPNHDWERIVDKTAIIWGALGELDVDGAVTGSSTTESSGTGSGTATGSSNLNVYTTEAEDENSAVFGNVAAGYVEGEEEHEFEVLGEVVEIETEDGASVSIEEEEIELEASEAVDSGTDGTSETEATSQPDTDPEGDDAFLHEGFEGDDHIFGWGCDRDSGTNRIPCSHVDEAVNVTDEVSRAGSHSMRIHIDSDWDFSEVNSVRVEPGVPSGERRNLYSEDICVWREPFWTAFSIYIPNDWEPDSIRESIFEFHRDISDNPDGFDSSSFDVGSGKPLLIEIDEDELSFISAYQDDNGDFARDWLGPTGDQDGYPVEPGNWYDVVMNIKWSIHGDGDTGFMRIWVNGELVYDHEGNTTADDVAHPRPGEFGVYKWMWDGGDADVPTRTYYFDEFRWGDADATYEGMVPGER